MRKAVEKFNPSRLLFILIKWLTLRLFYPNSSCYYLGFIIQTRNLVSKYRITFAVVHYLVSLSLYLKGCIDKATPPEPDYKFSPFLSAMIG